MAVDGDAQASDQLDNRLELEKLRAETQVRLRESRNDVLKVVFGTMIVGVAAAFFPFAQEYARSYFAQNIESIKTDGEYNRLKLKQELETHRQSATDLAARREYLEKLATEVRSNIIERQIIAAEFFSYLGEPDMRPQWEGFRDYLYRKQEKLNKEKEGALARVGNPDISALERSSAIDRVQQIDRLQNSAPPAQFLTFLHYQNSSASRSFAEKAVAILSSQGFRVFPPTVFKSGETLKGTPYVSYFIEPGSRSEQQDEIRRAAEKVAEILTEAGRADNIGPFITKPHFDIPGQSRNLGVWF